MTPSGSAPFDVQALIRSNCRLYLGDHVNVHIISEVDSSGSWTAHVLKTENGIRSPVFSETSTTVQEALDLLHKKSAMGVHMFVTTNGFGHVPSVSSRRHRRRARSPASDDDDDFLSVKDGLSDSESEDGASDSDNSLDESLYLDSRRRTVRRPQMAVKQVEAKYMPHTESCIVPRHLAAGRHPHPRLQVPRQPVRPSPALQLQQHLSPPPLVSLTSDGGKVSPPPIWDARRTLPPPPLMPSTVHTVAAAPPRGVLPRPTPVPNRGGVLLCIVWEGHGEINVLENCPLSVSCIQTRAVQMVRTRKADFKDTASVDMLSLDVYARIRRLYIAGQAYELGSFHDDLSALYSSTPAYPRVEVEIKCAPLVLKVNPSRAVPITTKGTI